MISPKLAILMATMAVIGAGAIPMAPMALAQDEDSQSVEIERNNEIEQSIKQEQEACTNEAEVSVSDDDVVDIGGENEAEVEQVNICDVTQSQSAANVGSIVDNSENTFDISQFLLDIDVPDPNSDCAIRNGQFVCQ
jgi:hypothetical protein